MATDSAVARTDDGNLVRPRPLGPVVSPQPGRVEVSLVIPVLNEEQNLEELHAQIDVAMRSQPETYEIIFVDDGSTDGSFAALRRLQAEDEHVRVVRLRRNFGQTAAFSAGFDLARGNVIITMDADLQNDPADIPLLLAKVAEGCDIVSGWRVNRMDQYLKRRLPSRLANGLISRVTGVRLHDYGCSLKAYRREVIQNVQLYGELHRFIPALASWIGVQVSEVPVNHRARRFGRSKYGLNRTVKVLLDLLTVKFLLSYATRPIQVFGLAGAFSLALGLLTGGYLTFERVVLGMPLADRPLLLMAVLLVVLGVQLIIMGLLGELVIRTYFEVQNKPRYVVRETLDNTGLREEGRREYPRAS